MRGLRTAFAIAGAALPAILMLGGCHMLGAADDSDRPASARALIRMLDACAEAGRWTDEDAEAWWRIHLPPSSSHRIPAADPQAHASPVLVR